jgi:hypothetical protein
MADYSKYAKLDPATLAALRDAYTKQGVGSMVEYGGYDNSGQAEYVPTTVNGYQIARTSDFSTDVPSGEDLTPAQIAAASSVGGYTKQIGDDLYIYNTNGDLTQVMPTGGRWGTTLDMVKFLGPTILSMGFPGAGAALGNALGVGATAGSAIVGALTSAVTGGDWKTGLITGGLGANASTNLGGGFTIGDALKGIKAIQAISSGNILSAFSSIASMSGVGSTKVGDTGFTINELAKDANLLNAVIKGNPVALMNTISSISKSASSNSPSNTAYTKEDYDNLSPELQAIYNTQGPAGIKAYIEQQKADIAAQKANQDEIDRLNALHPPPVEQPPVEQPPPPPPEQPPTGNLPTVAVTAPPPPAPIVDLTPTVTPPPPVTAPLIGALTVTAPKCDPGFHYDEALKQCVPDEAALPPVTSPVTSTTTTPVNPKDPIVPKDPVVITANKYCNIGEHWDEASGKCVPDVVDLTSVVAPPLTATAITPTVTATPTAATTPTRSTTTTSGSKSGSSYADMKLNSFDKYLAGIYSPQKLVSLASLHQLFDSLTPDMKSFLSERDIAPPPMPNSEQTSKEDSSMNEKNFQTAFVASGGSIATDMAKMINDMSPKYERSATMLAAAPMFESHSPLGVLKHIRQGPLKGAGLSGGLAHGGLPHKYAKAAPEGHNPEFITGITGYYAQGGGTGQSDDIPAMLHDGDFVMDADTVASLGDGSSKAGAEVLEKMRTSLPHQHSQSAGNPVPAKIADGEYVFPAAFVTAIGGGSNKIGAQRLNEMREKIRAHKRSAPDSKIPPKAKSPLDYLKMAKG